MTKTNDSNLQKFYSVILTYMCIVVGTMLTIKFFSNTIQNTAVPETSLEINFPLDACGDPNLTGSQDFFPVFVNPADQTVLNRVKTAYCRDAFLTRRLNSDKLVIQVASFTSADKAHEFGKLLLKDPAVGSYEIGEPTQF
jgi:hypothetical protein